MKNTIGVKNKMILSKITKKIKSESDIESCFDIYLSQNSRSHPEYGHIIPNFGQTGFLVFRESEMIWVELYTVNVKASIASLFEEYDISPSDYVKWHSIRYPSAVLPS